MDKDQQYWIKRLVISGMVIAALFGLISGILIDGIRNDVWEEILYLIAVAIAGIVCCIAIYKHVKRVLNQY